MSRLLILLIFAVWMLPPLGGERPLMSIGWSVATVFSGYLTLVMIVRTWSRRLARDIGRRSQKSLDRFNWMLMSARFLVPAWLLFNLYGGPGWKYIVQHALRSISLPDAHGLPAIELPSCFLGILPSLLTWVALWWAAYPAERALREQSLLNSLDSDLPLHAPPPLGKYLLAQVRQSLLFILVPVLMVLMVHDALSGALRFTGRWSEEIDQPLQIAGALMVYLFAPVLLRRILNTRPLPDSPLRRRLEAICRRAKLGYRDILLWNTDYSMGNAAVMGLVPRLRYIMMSDLLLETMDDRQIEAVFAHELGHVKHHHMGWFVVFFVVVVLAAMGPVDLFARWLGDAVAHVVQKRTHIDRHDIDTVLEVVLGFAWMAATLAMFGYISRRFERQADVFAARMIQTDWCSEGMGESASAATWPTRIQVEGGGSVTVVDVPEVARRLPVKETNVGHYGAMVFSSALERVAVVNNIPVAARSWCHGSIAKRMKYLNMLGRQPELTRQFDGVMRRLKLTLVVAGVVFGAWCALAPAESTAPAEPAVQQEQRRVVHHSYKSDGPVSLGHDG